MSFIAENTARLLSMPVDAPLAPSPKSEIDSWQAEITLAEIEELKAGAVARATVVPSSDTPKLQAERAEAAKTVAFYDVMIAQARADFANAEDEISPEFS